MRRAMVAVFGVAAAGMLLFPTAALGAPDRHDRDGAGRGQQFTYDLKPVPHHPRRDGGSKVRGVAEIMRDGDRVTVKVSASGLSPNLVHVQHIHGVGDNRCPRAEARNDRENDRLIDTAEGLPDYGEIRVSLTTTDDTSPASGLAVERFPVADGAGRLAYERTFTVGTDFSREVADNLARHHVVVHGIDVNHKDGYDFEAGVSPLDPTGKLPLEAELPATCGVTKHNH